MKKIKLNTQCVCNCMAILLLWLPHSMQFPSIWMFFVKLILCKWHLKWSFASIPVIPSSASARCNRNSMKKKNYKIDCGKVTAVHSPGLNHVCVDTKSDKKRMLPPANQQKIISMKQWFRHCFVVMYSWQWQSCRKCPRKLTRNSHVFTAKPISLVERCHCRVTVNNIPKGYIRELRFIQTPSCPFQVMWVLLFYIYIYI